MKYSTVSNILGIQTVGLIIFFIFLLISQPLDFYKTQINNIFIASIGILTFISIFYGVLLNSESILKEKEKTLKKDINEKIDQKLKEVMKKQDKLSELGEILDLKYDVEHVETITSALNVNKWLYFAVLMFILSILSYTFPQDSNWVIYAQIISFYVGIVLSMFIVTTWFCVNNLDKQK